MQAAHLPSVLKQLLAGLGLRVERLAGRVSIDEPREAKLLRPVVRDMASRAGRRLTLIQVGANDGRWADPVHDLIDADLVEAVLVEPMPEPFERLAALHRGNPNVHPVNAAVAPREGVITLHAIRDGSGAYRFGKVTSSDRRLVVRHLEEMKARRDVRDTETAYVAEVQRPARTVSALMAERGWQTLDVLALDAEGMDWQIVEGLLAEGVDVTVIFLEVALMSRSDYASFVLTLGEAGYGMGRSGRNLIAVREAGVRPSAEAVPDVHHA